MTYRLVLSALFAIIAIPGLALAVPQGTVSPIPSATPTTTQSGYPEGGGPYLFCTPEIIRSSSIYNLDGTIDKSFVPGGDGMFAGATLSGTTYYAQGKPVLSVHGELRRRGPSGAGPCEGYMRSLGITKIEPAVLPASGSFKVLITMAYCMTGTPGVGAGCPVQTQTAEIGWLVVEDPNEPEDHEEDADEEEIGEVDSARDANSLTSNTATPVELSMITPIIGQVSIDDGGTIVLGSDVDLSVKQGETFTIMGLAGELETVTVTVRSEPRFYTTQADSDGRWSLEIPTDELEMGDHTVSIASVTQTNDDVLEFTVTDMPSSLDSNYLTQEPGKDRSGLPSVFVGWVLVILGSLLLLVGLLVRPRIP